MGRPRKGVRKRVHRSGRITWQARWYNPDGHRESRNFPTMGEAEAFLDAVQAAKRRNEYQVVVPPETRATVGERAEMVEARRRHRAKSTKARDTSLLRSLVVPHLGQRTLTSVTRDDIEEWADVLIVEGYASDTIRKAHRLIARVFDDAIERGELRHTPCRGLKLPKAQDDEKRYLTIEEVWRLADAVEPRYRAMVLLTALTGLRYEEVAGLKRSRIDLAGRSLKVTEALKRDGTLGPPKTKASRRSVALPQVLVPSVVQHLTDFPVGETGLVFTSPRGAPLSYTNFRRRVWMPAVTASVGEPLTFHDLRHSHVAILIAEGVHPKTIQARLGHESIRITLDVYGHLFDGADELAADAIDEALQATDGVVAGTQPVFKAV